MISLAVIAVLAAPEVLVDRVVAVVDRDVVTHSELLREARVALVMREDASAGLSVLPEELLDAFLTYLVDQLIIASQARRFGSIEVSEADVDGEVERFAQKVGGAVAFRSFLRRFDIPLDALRDILRRDLRNERFIHQRMRAWLSGEEGSSEARYREALARWLGDLRRGVELRLLNREGELELQREDER